jgi:hypothetical protein
MEGAVDYVCSGVLFTDCTIRGNQEDGVDIQGSDHVQLVGCSIYGNSRGNANEYNGVTVSGASDVVIANCMINAAGQLYTGYQGYAVAIESSSNVTVNGCDLSGNGYTPPLYIDMTSGETSTVQNNAGYNPVGFTSASPAPPGSGDHVQNYLGTAATIYLHGAPSDIWISDTLPFTSADKIIVTPVSGYPVRLAPGQYIKWDFSSQPSWQWFLD